MEYTNEFASRLKFAMRLRNKKAVDVCNATGLSSALISQYLTGKFEPKNDKAFIIANYLKINPAWLLGWIDDINTELDGKGRIIKNGRPTGKRVSDVTGEVVDDDFYNDDTLTEIPMDNIVFDDYFPLHYWSGLSAGSFEELIEAEPDSVVYVPITFQNKKKRLHAFKINGTSMNNVIPDGSIVVSEDNYNNAIKYTDGTIVVAFMDGTATVKRLYSGEDSITLSPDSTDKSHMPIIVPKDKELVIIGKVIWHMNPEDIAEKCY